MLDTVRFRIEFKPRATSVIKIWEIRERQLRNAGWEKGLFLFYHKSTEIRICKDWHGWSIEASLPKVLHGDNRLLLKSQNEINSALEKLKRILRTDWQFDFSARVFTRVDLCWQVPGWINRFIDAHRNLTHPEARGGKVIIYRDENIIWESKKERKERGTPFRLQMYDKRRERTGKQPGMVVRLEIQLRRDKLKRHLGVGNSLPTRLSFNRSYQVLRSVFLEFPKCDLYDRYVTKPYVPARIRLERFNIRWQSLLPRKRSRKFKKWHGCDVSAVPKYWEL